MAREKLLVVFYRAPRESDLLHLDGAIEWFVAASLSLRDLRV
jgi:hypothetical protein